MITAKTRVKKFAPIVLLSAALLSFAACKLTNYNPGTTPPPTGSTEYVFATSQNQVWSFAVNSSTGALSSGTSVTGPQLSEGIVVNPTGKFLYVSDTYNDQVDVFSISSTGTLTAVGSPYTIGSVPANNQILVAATGLAMDPTGSYLYATDFNNNTVAAFNVNATTGALTAIANSPFAAGTEPQNVIVDPTGSFAFVTDFGNIDGGVFGFSLSSGAPTPITGASQPVSTVFQGEPAGIAVTGQFMYVSEQANGSVFGVAISNAGLLSLVPNSTTSTGGSRPTGIVTVTTTSGKYLYVANNGTGNAGTPSSIAAYSIDSTSGGLTALATPLPTTISPFSLAVDPSGSFLYATNPLDNVITGFSINASNGALTQFSGSATSVGTEPVVLTAATIQ